MSTIDPKHWSKPVTFRVGPGLTFTVTNTEDAARYLLDRWSGEAGPAHKMARQACLDVLAEGLEPEEARSAFIAACEEAGMEVMPEGFHTRPQPRPKKKKGW
ncbi:DUF982 domain-containing protein [Ferirhizobium litorale]|uniref:DUF982 domain-containing protein n=1 Tax=Ferirhizobium litorale TaxID=2927786 RepID=A0AAE3QK10_9HYPH|nr:DUF982 domain-containing protein [Fererhizobium litorale]MDI7924619.1 DUF982 domain-containing protein [Fererhizobium litorale]